jgi:hypothetical protein
MVEHTNPTVKRKDKTRIQYQRRKSRRIEEIKLLLWDTHLTLIKMKDMKYTILIVTGLETRQRRIGRTIGCNNLKVLKR